MDFYKHLNYSLGNEDWDVESQALRVAPGERAICVTASGDRPLHLLTTECAEIISIDMNRIQNFLLELKLAALSNLDYEKYLAFLGCTFTPHRYEIFNQMKSSLSKEAALFWTDHKKMIVRGVIYQGIVERLTNATAKLFKLIRAQKIITLFSFNDIEEQRHYVTKEWDSIILRKIFEICLNPNIVKFLIKDPGVNSFVEVSSHPGKYIYQRMMTYLHSNLAKKSALLQLLMTGKVQPEAYFPYLTFNGYSAIRKNMGRLQFKTANIVEFLNQSQPNEIDCFSMSDIASYMPQPVFEKLLQGIYHAAKPNARFCLREFMSKRHIPTAYTTQLPRNTELEKKLELEESNFVYRFFAGEVCK